MKNNLRNTVFILTLFIGSLFSTVSYANSTTGYFTDTKEHWAKQSIADMATQGLVSGYSDGSFRPNNNITYAEFNTFLYRAIQDQLKIVSNNATQLRTISADSKTPFKVGDQISIKMVTIEKENVTLTSYPISYGVIKNISGNNLEIEVTQNDYNKFQEIVQKSYPYEVIKVKTNTHWAFQTYYIMANSTQPSKIQINVNGNNFSTSLNDISFNQNYITSVMGCFKTKCITEDVLDYNITREQVAKVLLSMYLNIKEQSELVINFDSSYPVFSDTDADTEYSKAIRYSSKQLGFFSGVEQKGKYYFDNKDITRAEAVIVIQRFLSLIK